MWSVGCNGGGGGTSGTGTGTGTGTATSTGTGTTVGEGDLPPQDPCAVEHGPGWATFDGVCACERGLVLCGGDCVDLANDPAHCGTCATVCRAGLACVQGSCGGFLPGPGVRPPRRLSGGDPESTCTWATEAVPEVSVNAAPGEPDAVVAYQLRRADTNEHDAYYNWRLPSGDWTPDLHPSPDAPEADAAWDPWSATHGGTGTEFFTFQGPLVEDLVAWGTTPAQLAQQGPPTMAPRLLVPGSVDGASLLPDLGAPAIYVAYHDRSSSVQSVLRRYAPCEAADLGGPGCPEAWDAPRVVFSGEDDSLVPRSHVSASINPCTHHAVVALRVEDQSMNGSQDTRIVYRFVDAAGDLSPVNAADSFSVTFGTTCGPIQVGIPKCNTGTADCGDFGPCLDMNRRVHLAARYVPDEDRCLLYAAYDVVQGDEAFVRLAVLDVTDETLSAGEALLEIVESHAPGEGHRDFLGTVAADRFTGAVGVFFYRQEGGDPCSTTFRGRVRRPGQPFQDTGPIAGPFPSLEGPSTGSLGHYVRAAGFSQPGTRLSSWSQPVPTSDPACTACNGTRWSLAVYAAEVVP